MSKNLVIYTPQKFTTDISEIHLLDGNWTEKTFNKRYYNGKNMF